MSIRFDDRVVIVTGGGNGLGRAHCFAYAKAGAKVVVNDLGGGPDGSGASLAASEAVVKEIQQAGGQAIASGASVTDREQVDTMVQDALSKWGRVDVLVNNAGILRDKSFAKMEMADFERVLDVHLTGSANCAKAVWSVMTEQRYGRIVMTSSSSGIFGNFGQANYAAAKMGVIGLMNTLHLEGRKYDIRVNALAPFAGTRLLDDLMPQDITRLADPALVSPAVLFLTGEKAPSRTIMGAGAGAFTAVHIYETQGKFLGLESVTADDVAAHWDAISSPENERLSPDASHQSKQFLDLVKAGV
ncbi:MAG: SDR family NAD(P)-dependent oxidoreductase [Pseudomonadota bacterium]